MVFLFLDVGEPPGRLSLEGKDQEFQVMLTECAGAELIRQLHIYVSNSAGRPRLK